MLSRIRNKFRKGNLSVDIVQLLFGKFGAMVAGLLSLTAATHLTTLAQFGAYSYGLVIANLCLIFGLMGFQRLTVREVAKHTGRGETKKAVNFALHVVFLALILLTFTVVAALFFLPFLTQDPLLLDVARMSLILVFPFALLRLSDAFFRGRRQFLLSPLPDQIGRPLFFSIVVFTLYAITPVTANLLTIGQFASSLLALFMVALILKKQKLMQQPGSKQCAKPENVLHDGYTLGLVTLSAVLFNQLPVLSLGLFSNADNVALYAAPVRVALMVGMLFTVVNQALSPSIAQLWERGDKKKMAQVAATTSSISFAISVLVSIPILLYPEFVLVTVLGENFREGKQILRIVTLVQLFNVATGSVTSWLTMTGHQGSATRANLVSLLAACVSAVYLVPLYKEVGAAIVYAIGIVLSNSLQAKAVMTHLKFNPTVFGIFPVVRKKYYC